MFNKKAVKLLLLILTGVLGFYVTLALANTSIGNVADIVTSSFSGIAKLITAGAYIAGFGLTVGALFKFKQHKDNPQQVQLGTCITMLLIGVSLIFLPSIVSTGGQTVFGGNQTEAGINGSTNM